jgi:hypothetical protein
LRGDLRRDDLYVGKCVALHQELDERSRAVQPLGGIEGCFAKALGGRIAAQGGVIRCRSERLGVERMLCGPFEAKRVNR